MFDATGTSRERKSFVFRGAKTMKAQEVFAPLFDNGIVRGRFNIESLRQCGGNRQKLSVTEIATRRQRKDVRESGGRQEAERMF